MYNLEKAESIYKSLKAENADFDHKLVMDWKEQMPEEFAKAMYEMKYGYHIISEELYNEAVSLLHWQDDKGRGAKWSYQDIVRWSGIDFDNVDFYELDYAYVVNMLYSDYCNILTDSSYYLKMAKAYLTDPDYMGEASERAYYNAKKRIRYND